MVEWELTLFPLLTLSPSSQEVFSPSLLPLSTNLWLNQGFATEKGAILVQERCRMRKQRDSKSNCECGWAHQNTPEHPWTLHNTLQHPSTLLNTPEHTWTPLNTSETMLKGVKGCSRMFRDAQRWHYLEICHKTDLSQRNFIQLIVDGWSFAFSSIKWLLSITRYKACHSCVKGWAKWGERACVWVPFFWQKKREIKFAR